MEYLLSRYKLCTYWLIFFFSLSPLFLSLFSYHLPSTHIFGLHFYFCYHRFWSFQMMSDEFGHFSCQISTLWLFLAEYGHFCACKDCPMITCHPLMMTDWTEVLEPFHLQARSQDNPQVNHQGKQN